MNYDTMSVHELVGYLVYAPDNLNIHVTCMHDYSKDHDIIETALRKACIREASVGVGTVRRLGKAPLEGAPEMDVSCETKDGDYDLIPHKETP